ncbi:MAG: DUF1343 domain-containing protein [candidate division WOR-3 bacterium]|nr:MAG: DUF1343 domain-containing protein [candidate division WOR-3 bacterium]
MLLGIDRLVARRFTSLYKTRIGLYSNISSCDSRLLPTIEILRRHKLCNVTMILAPEHGLFGAQQDQERSKDYYDRRRKMWVYSLYGKKLVPDMSTSKKIDTLVIDVQDIGTRYYTFVWSAVLLIQHMAQLNKKVIILDRPNPLNGTTIEGPVLTMSHRSFVGLYPIPVRHGLTIAELCNFINTEYDIGADIEVIPMKGWHRRFFYHDTGLHWTIPSPNMPSYTTAFVYPGMCLLEGTNVSEGRGTTRPFELFGAPWIDPFQLVRTLQNKHLAGAAFRPTVFIPTFHKFKNELCGGAHIYITDIKKFEPVVTGLTIIKVIRDLYRHRFAWRKPPYEFEKHKLPFDILIGNEWVRKAIENGVSINTIQKRWQKDLNQFKKMRKKYLLYT